MESRTKVLGHAIHPMLIPFPLGLLATSVVFDVVHLISGNGRWGDVAFWMIAAGIVGGVVAAPFGTIDWLAIPSRTRAKTVGAAHGLGNVAALVLFGLSWLLRYGEPTEPTTLAVLLSLVGVAIAGVTGWLGGELVERLAVGVDDGAHLQAPNSLSGRPAHEGSQPRARAERVGEA